MVCFYHPDRAAVGTCKHCQRGLCTECAVLVQDSLACNARHESQVAAEVKATERSVLQAQRIAVGYLRNGIFYGLVAAAFWGLGFIQFRFLGLQAVFFMLVGLFLAYAALANFLEARRFR